MRVASESRATHAAELLLAHCAVLSAVDDPGSRRPVFERLRELLGADLVRFLLFGLSGAQWARSPRRSA